MHQPNNMNIEDIPISDILEKAINSVAEQTGCDNISIFINHYERGYTYIYNKTRGNYLANERQLQQYLASVDTQFERIDGDDYGEHQFIL